MATQNRSSDRLEFNISKEPKRTRTGLETVPPMVDRPGHDQESGISGRRPAISGNGDAKSKEKARRINPDDTLHDDDANQQIMTAGHEFFERSEDTSPDNAPGKESNDLLLVGNEAEAIPTAPIAADAEVKDFLVFEEKVEFPNELVLACSQGNKEVVEWIVNGLGMSDIVNGLDINARDSKGRTALIWTAIMMDSQSARILIDAGADKDLADENGYTPLAHACAVGDIRMVKLFMKSGAKTDTKDKWGMTPSDIASWNGHSEIIGLFSQHEEGG